MWAEHLDIARDRTLIAEHNLPEGVARIGAAMHLLQRDLVVSALDPALIPGYQQLFSTK